MLEMLKMSVVKNNTHIHTHTKKMYENKLKVCDCVMVYGNPLLSTEVMFLKSTTVSEVNFTCGENRVRGQTYKGLKKA